MSVLQMTPGLSVRELYIFRAPRSRFCIDFWSREEWKQDSLDREYVRVAQNGFPHEGARASPSFLFFLFSEHGGLEPEHCLGTLSFCSFCSGDRCISAHWRRYDQGPKGTLRVLLSVFDLRTWSDLSLCITKVNKCSFSICLQGKSRRAVSYLLRNWKP